MKQTIFMIIFLSTLLILNAFEITGNVKSWQLEDFIGSDLIGDTTENIGDVSSVFSRIENEKLFLRVTFNDMYDRNHISQKDLYQNQELLLKLNIKNLQSDQSLLSKTISLSEISENQNGQKLLRTPQSELIEISFPWQFRENIEQLSFQIDVLSNGKISDSFEKNGNTRDGGGNAAFVHHGNQGLTYTEVFYGQYPQETSGFDEVLQVHEATGIPGNFHMSGTLMPAAEWHNPEFNDWLRSGIDDGYVAMMTSALGQHMMPFLNNDMNDWSVHVECDMVEFMYNYDPKVAWIPERVWLSPDTYPNNGVIDWIGDNWEQHGVEGIVLDDWPHMNGYSNSKIHWMNNGSGINLRVIPINNDFVGKMHYDLDGAKNTVWNIGQYGIAVYGTDWEVAAEMNEHHGTFRLDNYEDMLWWCYNNYPAVNVWKLDSALNNPDFNGEGVDLTNGTYGLLGGMDGYGGSNNSWYNQWAATASHSDFHDPVWNYGYIWNDAYNNLSTAPNNSLSQLGWYTMMINLHETGWHDGGEVSGWEHRYSSHIKNANVYTEASRWAAEQYTETTAAFFSDIDHDGGDELIMHNNKIFAVFEGIGGKINWLFYKDGYGNAYSVVGSDVAYWSETDGDYNEGSANHFAALSDVEPNQQSSIYDISIQQSSGDIVQATLDQWGVKKIITLETDNDYLDCDYDFFGSTGYIKSGWTPDLLDCIWSGKSHLQRLYGDYASYAGWRNSTSGASVAYVLGTAGGNHQGEFEGTLVKGDEIYGNGRFNFKLYAGYTGEPYGTGVTELNDLAAITIDSSDPRVSSADIGGDNIIQLVYDSDMEAASTENINNYVLNDFSSSFEVISAKLFQSRKVILQIDGTFAVDDSGTVTVYTVKDANGNLIDPDYNSTSCEWFAPAVRPHLVGDMNSWTTSNHTYDFSLDENGVWVTTVSAGTYEYKVIESESWNGNDWPNCGEGVNQSVSSGETITVYANCGFNAGQQDYDEFVFHSPNPLIVCGDFLSELGETDWDQTTTITQMNDNGTGGDDTANDGIYTYQTLIPVGDYEFKIVFNNDWCQSSPAANYEFSSSGTDNILFYYNMASDEISLSTDSTLLPPENLSAQLLETAIQLDWDAPSMRSLNGYNIYRDDSLLTNTVNTTYLDYDVTDGTFYTYEVSATYELPTGESAHTDSVVITYHAPIEISGISFLPDDDSDFTNFNNSGSVAAGDSVKIEIEIDGADIYNNSSFSATLHYTIDNETWLTKDFDWFSNVDTLSYWRVTLDNGNEIENGNSIKFYVTASDFSEDIDTDNNNGEYYFVNVLGLSQEVTVTFSVNLGGLPADSVSILGDNTPLFWEAGSTLLSDIDEDKIFTVDVTFAEVDNDTIHYKYARYHSSLGEWETETLTENRYFVIDDSDSTQVLELDFWNDEEIAEMTAVSFLPDSNSDFTNFAHTDTLSDGSSVFIEAEVDGIDINANSDFSANLHYSIDGEAYQTKEFYWYTNVIETSKSYWRIALNNGDEIFNGDSLHFYLTATDYNGPEFTDNNNGYGYIVEIADDGTAQEVTVTFSINIGSMEVDSLALQGSASPLDWNEGSNLVTDPNGDKIYTTDVIFPAGRNYEVQYKYTRNESETWFWETIDNRSFTLDDSNPTQILPLVYWNNSEVMELDSVRFLGDSESEFTNFENTNTLAMGSSLDIEAEITGADIDANSGFEVALHYETQTTSGTKDFYWHLNDVENDLSYWRVTLENGVEIADGDSVGFYLTATDYNGPEHTDDNSGNNYTAFIDGEESSRAVTVTFTLDLGATNADNVSLQGSVAPLDWTAGSSEMSDPELDNIYTLEVLFPSGSLKDVEYKYAVILTDSTIWTWETTDNRSFEIDDSGSTQSLPTDIWNNGSLSEITGVTFLPLSFPSEFTNFDNGDTLNTGSSIDFEIEIAGVDEATNSNFSGTLNYTFDEITWHTKGFGWYSNNVGLNKSYWRATLENGNEISNGDDITFYISASDYNGPTVYDNNSEANYTVHISNDGTSQPVTVSFSLNLGSINADSVSVQGSVSPLDWNPGSSQMTDIDADNIYEIDVLFPTGSDKTVEYKYTIIYSDSTNYTWESISNRSFTIDDSDTIQSLEVDYWNDIAVNELTGVSFLPENYPSEFTNFNNNGSVPAGNDVYIEIEINGADVNANSDFSVSLNYSLNTRTRNTRTRLSKSFDWFSNNLENTKSYWRVALENGVEISDGDEIEFYITGTDYNGPEYSDNNYGNNYSVSVADANIDRCVTVTFTLKLGTLEADSVFIQGNTLPLVWDVGSTKLANTIAAGVYEVDVTFPNGSSTEVEYKYARNHSTLRGWEWESIANRSFFIDDADSVQTLEIDYWNDIEIGEITAVSFKDSTNSDFTNFIDSGSIAYDDSIKIEAEITGVDINANSFFTAVLHYTLNDTTWISKSFGWSSNNEVTGKSYWQVTLANGSEIENDDTVSFYITAEDYNGPEYTDDNSGSNYSVTVGVTAPPDAPVNVTISIAAGNVNISWDAVTEATSYKVYSDTNPYGTFSTVEWTGTDTSWSEAVSENRKFYYVKAMN